MNTQSTRLQNQNHSSFTQFSKPGTLGIRRSNVLATLCTLLVVLACASASWAQMTLCNNSKPGGGRYCASPQYRFSPDLTGAPFSDVLGVSSVNKLTLKFSEQTNGGSGGATPLISGPSSSPSVITRSIFASQDNSGNWGLWAYGLGGGSYGWDTITQGTTISAPIRSSPGYATRNVEPYIYVGAEDWNVYAFGYTDGFLGWKYQMGDAIDSSPTVSDADEVYMMDDSGDIVKLDGVSGTPFANYPFSWGNYPSGANPASSIALSTCGGKYSACHMLIVAGSDNYQSAGGSGYVSAFDSNTTASLWTQGPLPYPIASSPVVSDSLGLVFAQSEPNYYPFGNPHWNGKFLYALDQSSGSITWTALPPAQCPPSRLNRGPQQNQKPPASNGSCYVQNYGSPAYDDTNKKVVAAASVNYIISDGQGNSSSTFENSFVAVYDAQRNPSGDRTPLCSANPVAHPITYSSPTVSNGVIWIGTDDGHMLAFDESNCNQIWDSATILGTTGAVVSPPVLSINRVHWVDRNGTLWVVGLPGF
jgi:outer membrane protein assembly factor BamB